MDQHKSMSTKSEYMVITRNPESKKPNPKIGLSA
jgi:hypothetical protein